jgi:hypothetical protein
MKGQRQHGDALDAKGDGYEDDSRVGYRVEGDGYEDDSRVGYRVEGDGRLSQQRYLLKMKMANR